MPSPPDEDVVIVSAGEHNLGMKELGRHTASFSSQWRRAFIWAELAWLRCEKRRPIIASILRGPFFFAAIIIIISIITTEEISSTVLRGGRAAF